MKITFTVESDEERAEFDPENFNREEYLEAMGFPSFVTKKLKKNLDNIRFTAEAGGLRINRELLGINLEDLYERAGIPANRLQKYEEGEEDINNANILTLLKICKAMECTLSEILTDKETIEALKEYLGEEA